MLEVYSPIIRFLRLFPTDIINHFLVLSIKYLLLTQSGYEGGGGGIVSLYIVSVFNTMLCYSKISSRRLIKIPLYLMLIVEFVDL